MRMTILSYCVAVLLALSSMGLAGAQEQESPDIREIMTAIANEEFLDDPELIMAWVTVPRSINKGDSVTLEITIENTRKSEVFRLSSIDIEKEFISGFKIVELSPEPRNRSKSLGDVSFEYPIDIPAGETRVFQIQLRAQKAGIYIGDVDIYEGERCLTRVAQSRVR